MRAPSLQEPAVAAISASASRGSCSSPGRAAASQRLPTSCERARGSGSRAGRPCAATATAGPARRPSAVQAGASDSCGHLLLRRRRRIENPTLREGPKGEEKGDEEDRAAVVV